MRAMLLSLALLGCHPGPGEDSSQPADTGDTGVHQGVRVPAEWEPHAATWLQWPKPWEALDREPMARIIAALLPWEPVVLIVTAEDRTQAEAALRDVGVEPADLSWHEAEHDWCWMRDNGPLYVERDGAPVVQDWGFDGWGGLGNPYEHDDAIPCTVAGWLGLPCEVHDPVIERGTMEFNGVDTLITSWPCLHDRNPDLSRAELEAEFTEAFGVTRVIWLERYPHDDLTKGHVDGLARFIDAERVVVPRSTDPEDVDAEVFEDAARILGEAGLTVLRMDIPGAVTFRDATMAVEYANWLVTDQLVLLTGFGEPTWDAAAEATVAGYFPGREVRSVEALQLWYDGGGVHCVTNDQPAVF
ncbi:MAG: agmatine deiminase family protein [Pseudomonadota bacterium]